MTRPSRRQLRRPDGFSGGKRQLDRVELGAHVEASAGQQMLQTLAEQPVWFDQEGVGRGRPAVDRRAG